MEFRIYCDESVKDGKFFSNFYGGVLVRSRDLRRVERAINTVCEEHHFNTEIKWQKVTANYLQKYIALMDTFFDLMEADLVKVRIMFTQNANRPLNLSDEQLQNEYFILYYWSKNLVLSSGFCWDGFVAKHSGGMYALQAPTKRPIAKSRTDKTRFFDH